MTTFPNAAQLQAMTDRYAPVELAADLTSLSTGDRKALDELLTAAHVVDRIFLRQFWSGDAAMAEKLRQTAEKKGATELDRRRYAYFWLNKGPWSALDGNAAFLPDAPAVKPLGANFYPENMTKSEFESWLKTLSPAEQTRATGFYSVIVRENGRLKAVPFSQAYPSELKELAAHLRKAAALTDNATLKKFLELRAKALLDDDYYDSDVAWMDLDAPIDVTIGPYETYNDELFGYKASFEAYVTLRDEAETAKVAAFGRLLQTIENNLPIDDKYKNPQLAPAAPIRVVNQLACSGDGARGVLTAAFNLPNDERITSERGAKRVMLRNVQQAKFEKVLAPMAAQILAPNELKNLSFEWFFTHILAHELSHGIGPHQIKIAGRESSPRMELKELYSPLEEAKADILGLYSIQYMMDHRDQLKIGDLIPAGDDEKRKLYVTYLASSFRTLGFGLHEAHAIGMAIQVNYLQDHGAILQNADGSFDVDVPKMETSVAGLAHELLMIEATGDYESAKKLIAEMAVIRPAYAKKLGALKGVPIDIRPAQ